MPTKILTRFCCRPALAWFFLVAGLSALVAQTIPANPDQEPRKARAVQDASSYTLHLTTREVLVEVVARDRQNHPVNDLTQSELEVFEGKHKSAEGQKAISGFRIIDPTIVPSPADALRTSVVLPLGGRCEIRSTVHYEIAFHPGNWASGYHSIIVTTSRRHVTLSYRAQYYIGLSDIGPIQMRRTPRDTISDLSSAACYHPGIPASLALSAKKIRTLDSSESRYAVSILPGSLQQASVEEDSHHAQLEYGICTFSRSGNVLGYWHFSVDRTLSSYEMSAVLLNGWEESVVVPRRGNPALARIVVVEPKSGNLGTIDLAIDARTRPEQSDDSDQEEPARVLVGAGTLRAEIGTASLGSPLPRSNALCGDVYELPATTGFLPADFRVLNAVGAVYTNSLNVREQILSLGIPGSTQRSEWFGIDYYGQFWIKTPGKYLFVLNADDGADLYIDEHKLIGDDGIHPPQTVSGSVTLEAGRHTIHLPYFQGPTYVNLILQVKAPDEELKVFNLRDFQPPNQRKNSQQ
jgi:hypothetical protein